MKLLNENQKSSISPLSKRSVKGFTLLEVLVVIGIIFTLAGIGFGVFFKMQNSAREKETEAIINAVASAMDARSADISSAQRELVGILPKDTYPIGNDSEGSTEILVSYISGDFDGDKSIDIGAQTKLPEVVPNAAEKNSFLDSEGRIVDAWNTPIRYQFPGVYHTEDDGFDLRSAGIDRKFDTEDDIILK